MAGTPGIFSIFVSSAQGGGITVQIFYDPATGAIREQGTPPAALLADNTTGKTCPVDVTGPQGTNRFNVPDGTTRVRASQLASFGISTKDDITQFGVAVPAAAAAR